MYPPYTLPFAKMYINNSENLTPGVNQFPHVSSAETETHNHFCHKSAQPFDLPGFSRQKSDCFHMARYLLIDVWFCACLRKHILSKRKQVHAFWNRAFTATNRCNLLQKWHPYHGLNHWSLWEQIGISPFLPI